MLPGRRPRGEFNQSPKQSGDGQRALPCSGKGTTKSGMGNISTAMSATFTSCLLPSSVFLPLLILNGGTGMEAENTHRTDFKVDALHGWTGTHLHRSHPVTAGLLHLSLQVTAAPRHLSRLARVAPLRLIQSNDSRSPPYKSSSDSRSTPSEDKAKPRAHQQKCSEKYSRPPIALTKSSTQAERQERGNDDKQLIAKNLKSSGTLKHEQKSVKKHKEGRGEESSSPDVADSADDYRKDKRRHKTSVQDKVTANEASESVQPLMKPDKHLDKEKGWRRRQIFRLQARCGETA
ncbi:hypothetical protein E3U43_021907 [Larimichthys crocea]|uniref:Uncharacterized protein n=1 Tax=Larimichthys crocea TaxID=215358 RepID=A0ACD3R7U6_LARCR|nr:hypothetical protein E3U43_021907 [Larimichthys crocea]